MSTKPKRKPSTPAINGEDFEHFNSYRDLLNDVIQKNLIHAHGDPYKNTMAFLFAMENSKASLIASLDISGVVKGKDAMEGISKVCDNFGKKRMALIAAAKPLKKEIRSISMDEVRAKMQKMEMPKKDNNTMYR